MVEPEPELTEQVQRLHQLTVYSRWAVAVVLWLTVGLLSLWSLRSDIQLWREYFTWTAVRYALAYNPVPAVGLSLCVGFTTAILIWQSRNILFGLPKSERQRLEQSVLRIQRQGPSHPLWKWICR